MKTVSARQANHEFSDLLSRVERGEEILITKRSKPVAVLSPYRTPRCTKLGRGPMIRFASVRLFDDLAWRAAWMQSEAP
jgi:prevent-host-death family protein